MKKLTGRFQAFLLLWLLLMSLASWSLYSLEIRRQEKDLQAEAKALAASIKHKLDANEAVLAGFSSFLLAVDANDREAVTRYAAAISAAYPHIYMLEVARRVATDEEATFELLMRQTWRANFAIKNFLDMASPERQNRPVSQETWPILFMYPELPQAEALYGVRLETVPYLSHTLGLSKRNAKAVVSPVFAMYEGGNAYILLQEIAREESSQNKGKANYFGNFMSALLLIKTDNLLDDATGIPGLRIEAKLKSAARNNQVFSREPESAPSPLERAFLPRLSVDMEVGNETQVMMLRIEKQLAWTSMFTPTSALLGVLAFCACLAIPLLVFRQLRALETAACEQHRAHYLATHDAMTDLPNRGLFMDRVEQALLGWQRNGTPFALLFIDIDHFQQINEQYGHAVGDQVLRISAQRMRGELRATDSMTRHVGDQFMLLLEGVAAAEAAENASAKLLQPFTRPIEASGAKLELSLSIGIAHCPEHGKTFEELACAAEAAMRAAKAAGGQRFQVYGATLTG